MKSKELEIALTTYIALEHNQDECSGFIDGYKQCQENMANKKYTEEDMRECWRACLNFNKPAGLDSGINYSDFIKSLNKQDK